MAFEKYTTPQLKKYQRILLVSSIVGLVLMCFALGAGVYLMTKRDSTTHIYLVPTVFGPLAMIPSLFSARMGSEVKRRDKTANVPIK